MKEEILNLLDCLPIKDIELGKQFISNNNYEGLQDLVDSAVYMAKRADDKGNTTSNYFGLDIDKLETLQAIVDEYCEPFIINEIESDD